MEQLPLDNIKQKMIAAMNIKLKMRTASNILKSEGLIGLIRVIIKKFDGLISKLKLQRVLKQDSLSDRFSEIYRLGYWKTRKNKESASGDGSTKARSEQYLQELQGFLSKWTKENMRAIEFFDAPCGDLNWINEIFRRNDVQYHGADIVPFIITQNKAKFANDDITLNVFDITKDAFPNADVWHCRDCFFHLSYENIFKALENFVRSDISLALLTSHVMENTYCNRDIDDGDFRPLDLTKAPFCFPQPDVVLKDGGGSTSDPTRIVGLYSKEAIRQILEDRQFTPQCDILIRV